MTNSSSHRELCRQVALRTGALLSVLTLIAGCGASDSLGPSTPTGATEIGGLPMTSAPPPPPGWRLDEVIPTSYQQAVDTQLGHLRRLLQALPPDTVVDGYGWPGNGTTIWCEDEPADPDTAPVRLTTTGELKTPAGALTPQAAVIAVGNIWEGWGWYVIERDEWRKPNRFGYGPDGYRMQIEMPNPATYPPVLNSSSPCFPGELDRDDVNFPLIVRAD